MEIALEVNVPVNDVLQFRVAAISRRHNGYLNNAPQADGDDENTRSGRLSVALEPTSHLRMLFHCSSRHGARVHHEFHTNALSLIALLTPVANRLEAQRHGTLAVISSVAGDRGRPSNDLYGSAHAALQAFLEG